MLIINIAFETKHIAGKSEQVAKQLSFEFLT